MDRATSLVVPFIALCVVASVAGFASWFRPDARWLTRLGRGLGYACLGLGLVTWIWRWNSAGHLPLFGTYESALSLSAAVLLAALVAGAGNSGRVGIWPVACATAAALVSHGSRFDPTAFALTISERSWIVDIHALFAWAAFGALLANAALALHRLFKRSAPGGREERRLSFSLSLGFVLHSAMLATGSFYKFLLFGRAWSFDPVESLGFAAWVAYGTLLHMHLFAGWNGRRLAKWCIGLFLLLVASYRGIVYFPGWSTYHVFDMDLRIHVTGTGPAPGEARE